MVAPGARAWARLVLRARRTSIGDAVRHGPWLVIAPHPDDESLGAGSLLAQIADAGGEAHVAFLTDGTGSHCGAPGWSPTRVGWTRAGEARDALRQLGLVQAPRHLDWPDSAPHPRGSLAFERTVRSLVAWCRYRGIRAIAVTWRGEPHCDHEAAAELAAAVARKLRGRLYEYLVWGWTLPDVDRLLRGYRALSVDVAGGRTRQRRAIARHRSQTGTRIAGARDPFRLPKAMSDLAARPRLILLTRRTRHAS